MFFMMGITDGRKDFDFNQVITCDECGRYGRYQVYMTYMVLSLFFIPCFKWNRHYYVQTTCCNALYELDPEIGRRIARGEDVEILPQHLQRVNPQYGYGFENGSGNTTKDAAIVDIQLQRTLNSAPNAAGNCKFRRKIHGNLVLRGSFHRRRLCKFKEMRYRIR